MNALDALRTLAKKRQDEIVVTTMSAALEWPHYSTNLPLDLPLFNCMGKASSLALGVALGLPARKVWVLDGDGSLLMNLGSLVTIGHNAPSNLVHFVFQNGTYDSSGGQPIPGGQGVNYGAMALASGYKFADEFGDASEFASKLDSLLARPGPQFVTLKVDSMWATHGVTGRRTAQALAELPAVLAT